MSTKNPVAGAARLPGISSFVEFVTALGVQLTRAQRAFARIAFDGVEPRDLRGVERDLARQLFGKVERIPTTARSTIAVVAGARSGKTYLGGLRLLHLALTVHLGQLAPGEFAAAVIVAPDLRLARQALRFPLGAVRGTHLASSIVGETSDSVTLRRPDGKVVVLECLPATRGGSALRGRTLVGALLDESAFFRDEDFTVNDEALFAAVAPRVVRDGQILIFSTPWSPAGLLHELHTKNHGKPKTALAAHAPTLLLRDHDPAVVVVVERERARDPQNAAREYDALFLDGVSTLLASADVDAAVDRGIDSRPPRPRECVYGLTVDVGLRNDSSVATVFHVEGHARENAPPVRILVVDAIRILKPTLLHRTTLDEVEEMIASLARRYSVPNVHGDLHYADALAPRLLARGLGFTEMKMNPESQEKRATSLVARFRGRTIRLVSDPTLIKECKAVKLTRHPGGRVSIGAPEGKKKHDDCFDTLLLAAEVAASMPELGGDIGCELKITRNESSWSFETSWFERRPAPGGGTMRVPSGPPIGSPQWIELRRAQKAQGLRVLGEPDPDDFGDDVSTRVDPF